MCSNTFYFLGLVAVQMPKFLLFRTFFISSFILLTFSLSNNSCLNFEITLKKKSIVLNAVPFVRFAVESV